MLELQSNNLVFNFSDVHPCAKVTINFQRTLRIPDDDKAYPLPPGLGTFPVRHVEDFKSRLPEKWNKRGGVMLPMYQSEALWIHFAGNYDHERGVQYPFAIKIATGKTSALTGKPWSKHLKEKDYCIVPIQPWIDGYVVDDGFVRQFVAMPLGGGFTVEEQITGKAEFGGIQIEALPMKRSEYEKRFPKREPDHRKGITRSRSLGGPGTYALPGVYCSTLGKASLPTMDSMGLSAGGRMKQQIFDDPYGLSEWDTDNKTRCFVHLANSMMWRAITKEDPPTVPFTAEDYTRHNMPWFDYYSDAPALKGSSKLKDIKTVKQVGEAKKVPALPENTSVTPTNIITIGTGAKQVKDGVWK
jgi:hypothetical protein